jgi:hypothetical protein
MYIFGSDNIHSPINCCQSPTTSSNMLQSMCWHCLILKWRITEDVPPVGLSLLVWAIVPNSTLTSDYCWKRTGPAASCTITWKACNHQVQLAVQSKLDFNFFTRMNFLNSDCIAIWTVCERCRVKWFFLSQFLICNSIDIYRVVVEYQQFWYDCTATRPILCGRQIGIRK